MMYVPTMHAATKHVATIYVATIYVATWCPALAGPNPPEGGFYR